MIEFDETMSNIYSGKEALRQRIKIRLSHTTKSIPYYDRGIMDFEFTYGSQTNAIKMALRDFSPTISVDTENSRLQVYNVSINLDEVL